MSKFLFSVLLLVSCLSASHADKLGDFVDLNLSTFGDWLGRNNNSGDPSSPFPLLFDNIPVFNLTSGDIIGRLGATFNYSVEHSGPQNHSVSPLTNLEDRLLGIRLAYNWTYFYGEYKTDGGPNTGINCGGTWQPIIGNGRFELGKQLNFFGTAGMGWTNFTVDSNGYINLDDGRLQRYFLVDENSGIDKLEMEGLQAGGCEPFVRASILIALREQLGVSSDTIHPVPLYRQLDNFLKEKFAETPVSEM